jgi:hypothetical protein
LAKRQILIVVFNDYFLFYVPLENLSLLLRWHHCWWRAAKIRPMLGTLSKEGSFEIDIYHLLIEDEK